jgi:hypothetical protein
MAFAMALHARLGHVSSAQDLDPDLLKRLLLDHDVHPRGEHERAYPPEILQDMNPGQIRAEVQSAVLKFMAEYGHPMLDNVH